MRKEMNLTVGTLTRIYLNTLLFSIKNKTILVVSGSFNLVVSGSSNFITVRFERMDGS